jgi:hypothetical protein
MRDLTKQIFNRLQVVSLNPQRSLSGQARWDCVCDCGNKITVVGNSLVTNNTTSCGCYRKERTRETSVIHGMHGTLEYRSWQSMINRCTNVNNEAYNDYGGRGITVCDRWLNSFEAFYEDMGPRPSPNHSIDREENDLGYYKDNCRWATRVEQNNNRRDNVYYEHNGITKTISEWASEYGIEYRKLYRRLIRDKWDFERAINTP